MATENSLFTGDSYHNGDEDLQAIQLENDILKLKMQAEFGAIFDQSPNLPPLVEKAFLENVLAFENMGKNAAMVPVFELLGKPQFIPANKLDEEQARDELDKLLKLMDDHDLSLVLMNEYPALQVYRFVTEELFFEEIEDIRMPGLLGVFVYENFHPNHEVLIAELTTEFIEGWRDLHWKNIEHMLYDVWVLPDDRIIQEDEMYTILERERQRYESMSFFEFTINNIQFEWKEGNVGLGFSEGNLHAMAKPKNEPQVYLDGEFRCFFCNTDGFWRLTFFYLPGFDWR